MRESKFHGHGAFHGYWVDGERRVSRRFGSDAELRELRDALKGQGIDLLLDLVLNHVGPETKLPQQKPDWFHHNGSITDWNNQTQLESFDVHGLPDFAQEEHAVRDFLFTTSDFWLRRFAPRGFRLDAVKHVPISFWRAHNQALADRYVLLGEVFDGSAQKLAPYFKDGGFTHLFDYPLYYAMIDTLCKGEHFGRLASVLSQDDRYPDPQRLVTFLDNHDLPRIRTACGGELGNVKRALEVMFRLRGVPSITYGTESGLTGKGEPENRADMNFEHTPLLETIADLSAERRASKALNRGETHLVEVGARTFCFARTTNDETALVVVNLSKRPYKCRGLSARPRQVRVERAADKLPEPTEARAYALHLSTREVASSSQPDDTLLLVGSRPEVGDWDAARGVPFEQVGGRLVARVRTKPGTALAYKVVTKRGNTFKWPERGNRYLFFGHETRIELE